MKFAIAVLLGLMTINIEQTNALQVHRLNNYDLADLGSDESESDDSTDLEIDAAMEGPSIATKWDKKNPHPGYEANHDDFEGHEGFGKYDR